MPQATKRGESARPRMHMTVLKKIERAFGRWLISHSNFRQQQSTKVALFFYQRWGMRLIGRPNFISSSSWFDGADFSKITLSKGCTISRETRFLTHDWSRYNVGMAIGDHQVVAKSVIRPIYVGEYSFIGAGSLIMPGTNIGRGCIIGAGSVVRGKIPDYSLLVGNPAEIVGDTREYYEKTANRGS